MPAIHSNGITLTYETQGDPTGPPVLLIMGLGLQLISWPEAFCQMLVEHGFFVIRFDNRDSGLSSKMDHFGQPNLLLSAVKNVLRLPLSSGYTLHDMAKDAVGLLDGLAIGKAHIVGVSMGGMIAQIVAANYPDRTYSLTSIMSSSGRRGLPGPTRAARHALLSRPENPRDLESVIDHLAKTFRVIGSPAYPTPELQLRARLSAAVKRNMNPAGTARQLVAIAASGDRVKLLKSINVPALVIHGIQDPLIPIACGRDTARLIPGAMLREIDGMGHDLASELVVTISDMIDAHCKGNAVPEMEANAAGLAGTTPILKT
jgi:pimeloyl-ACP methyl ester carboxylesterase